MPCGNFPRDTKTKGGKVAIVNLQTTKQDRICDLRLWAYCDDVMTRLCVQLGVEIPGWDSPRLIYYSKHTGDKEKRDISLIIDDGITVVEDGADWEEHEKQRGIKSEVKDIAESRAHLITSIEVPGLKRDSGMGDIAAAAAIAAAAVRRIHEPRDPAPAPPSDDEEDLEHPPTIIAASLNTLPSNIAGTLSATSMPTMNVQQIDASQLMQHMQPGQMLTVTQMPAQAGQQVQQVRYCYIFVIYSFCHIFKVTHLFAISQQYFSDQLFDLLTNIIYYYTTHITIFHFEFLNLNFI